MENEAEETPGTQTHVEIFGEQVDLDDLPALAKRGCRHCGERGYVVTRDSAGRRGLVCRCVARAVAQAQRRSAVDEAPAVARVSAHAIAKDMRLSAELHKRLEILQAAQLAYGSEIDRYTQTVTNRAADVAEAQSRVKGEQAAVKGVQQKIADTSASIARLERRLAELREVDLQYIEFCRTAEADLQAAEQVLAAAKIEADASLAKPNRHLAALQKDVDRVASRLASHRARNPDVAPAQQIEVTAPQDVLAFDELP